MSKPDKLKDAPKTEIDSDLVRQLASLLDETGLTEVEYATDQWKIRVARHAGVAHYVAPHVSPAVSAQPGEAVPAPSAEPASDANHPGAILSPMVGTVYLASEPGAPQFARVGDEVKAGQTLLIVEAMKVMNPVTAPRGGRLAKICVENGAPVEFGAVLMIVE